MRFRIQVLYGNKNSKGVKGFTQYWAPLRILGSHRDKERTMEGCLKDPIDNQKWVMS